MTAGTVTHAGTVNDTVDGVELLNNTAGTINLLGTYTLNTGTHTAVTITGNANAANLSLTNLAINTTSGTGFLATGGGTLAVSGTTNGISPKTPPPGIASTWAWHAASNWWIERNAPAAVLSHTSRP